MAGQSNQSDREPKSFRPIDLMEGFASGEVLATIHEVEDLLQDAFGDDREIKITALSFLIGTYLKHSKVTKGQAFAMIRLAKEIKA